MGLHGFERPTSLDHFTSLYLSSSLHIIQTKRHRLRVVIAATSLKPTDGVYVAANICVTPPERLHLQSKDFPSHVSETDSFFCF